MKEILKHPDVSKVRNNWGNTPLHWLARDGIKKAWFHPDFNKIENDDGETPKDWWIEVGHKPITCMDFIERLLFQNDFQKENTDKLI